MFNPIEASSNIKQSYIDYISTTFNFANLHYQRLFRAALGKAGEIAKGPYLDASGSFNSGLSIKGLTDNGLVSKLFLNLENEPEKEKEIKIHRPLYSHQQEALLRADKGGNLVVTTGTGSGKTECFILPILQALLTEREVGTLSRSVRAIIIYPMNALANDQMKRLRKILATYPDITFGLYNSNTRHKQKDANSDYHKLNNCAPLPNEVISREMMQKEPPHILITNYSMLEYMLLRPKDDAVFSGAKLRYIVLDEAHIYRGATGMETSILMRRLRARISDPKTVQYILTSATLGGKDADDDIVSFAKSLCNAEFKAENIIRAEEVHQPMLERCEFPATLFEEIYQEKTTVSSVLQSYNADFAPEKDDNEKLYELMLRCGLFEKLRIAATAPKTINQLANEIGITSQELVYLVAASAKAVKDGTSLIKSRYHFFLRALEGAFITLAGKKEFFLTRKERDSDNNVVFECAVCEDCGRIALAGVVDMAAKKLFQPYDNFDVKTDYFLVKQKGDGDYFQDEDYDDSDDDSTHEEIATDEFDYIICPVCGAIEMESVANRNPPCDHGSGSYIKLRMAKRRKSEKVACPACEFGNFRRLYLGYEAATAVIGTALYEQLPDTEVVFSKLDPEEKVGFFGKIETSNLKTINKSRQFLAFSDSRADAAFFACYMEKSYQEFLRRRGLWQVCDKFISEGRQSVTVYDMIDELVRFFEKSGSFVELDKEAQAQTNTCRRHAYIAVMNELVSSRRPSGLMQLGKIAFCYAPKNGDKKNRWDNAISLIKDALAPSEDAERNARALLNLLMIDVVYFGALDAGTEFDLTGDEREYLFYAATPKKIVKMREEKDKSYRNGWIPRARTGKTKSLHSSTRITRVMRVLGMDDKEAWGLLENFWDAVLGFEAEAEYSLSVLDFDIQLYGNGLKFYRCNKCGRVAIDNCQNKCVNVKCGGALEEFDPIAANANNHYVNLYSTKTMTPLYIKEHTAQLSRDHAGDYQKKFVEKKINALSSSTTFEMGVDVGSLETVFMRDVPPTPANYVQRAGRAGRSLQSAAYAITYAKLSSHDFTYFKQPEDMISGKIKAPKFKLENEKVVRRHINAVALSTFLKLNEEVYCGDNQTELLNSNGYEKFKEYIASEPPYLRDLLVKSIPSARNFGITDWSWTDYLIGENGTLELAVNDFRETVNELEKERKRCRKAGDDSGAAAYAFKLKGFRGDTSKGEPRRSLIDFLVRNNILPKYGFPIDTVELLPDATSFGDNKRPQMQRDLQLAVAEYAPGAEIVADGKLYTSRYIRKLQSREHNWEYGWYAKCPHCDTANFYKDNAARSSRACISCGETISKFAWKITLEPRRGFVSEESKEVKMQKPERIYKTEDCYIGDPIRKIINKLKFTVNGKTIAVESTTNDSLVVLTQTRFRVCPVCGYAVGENEEKACVPHKTAYGRKCIKDDPSDLKEYYLSHDFKTDVARLTFEDSNADYNTVLSVLFALLEAVSKELDIERNDIKGCLFKIKLDDGSLVNSIVLYDTAAGGAGHIRRIITKDGEILSRVISRAVSLMDNCDCTPSCYKCLRNYYNQRVHDKLSREAAANFLREFIGVLEIIPEEIRVPISTNNESTAISIKETMPLKDAYQNWTTAADLFEDCEGLIEIMNEWHIPLADGYEAELQIVNQTIYALLIWEDKKFIICDELSEHEKNALDFVGWSWMELSGLNEDKLDEAFGGVLVG